MIREATAWVMRRLRSNRGTDNAIRIRLRQLHLDHITPKQLQSWESNLEPGYYLAADFGGNLYVMHNGVPVDRFTPPD